MVNITQLYNNIKDLVHQNFEYKTDEDVNLPIEINSFFQYVDGELLIDKDLFIVDDFSDWSGTQPVYSDFTLPVNHKIIIQFKDTPNVQIACTDLNNNWIYAQNIGYDNNGQFSYRTSDNQVRTMTYTFNRTVNSEYKIICKDEKISFYVNNNLIHTTQTYDPLEIIRKIRIYNNAENIDYIKVSRL